MAAPSSRSSTDEKPTTNDDSVTTMREHDAYLVSEMQRHLRGADHHLGGFSRSLLRGATVRSYSDGSTSSSSSPGSSSPRLTASFVVTPELCNGLDTLHGGAIATAVDVFTSFLVFMVHPVVSVTSDLHVSTVAPAPLGSTVVCVCRVDRAGGGLQYASCDLFREDRGDGGDAKRALVAKGLHTKYVLKERTKDFGGGDATATTTAAMRSKL